MTDIDKAFQDPKAVFTTPQAVLDDRDLCHKEKVAILKRWEYDARELDVAEEENMGEPGEGPHELRSILRALHDLGESPDTEHSPPTKQGGE